MINLRKKPLALAVSAILVSVAAYAAVQITINPPIALNNVQYGDRANMVRANDGTLIAFHMHETLGVGMVYDVQNAEERPARDFYVMTCKPDSVKTCNAQSDWSPEVNVSKSALKTSINADWKGNLDAAGALPYPGDNNKNNIKISGPVVAMSWISKYCPDGDTTTPAVIDPVKQRAVLYPERNSRVIPFSCVWSSASKDNGLTWSEPVQMSNGERDAMQDCSAGMAVSVNSDPASPDFNKKGAAIFSWQEDPQGLMLSEGDGPGDGAAGANVNHGTDIWYTFADIDLDAAEFFAVNRSVTRLTDNQLGFGVPGAVDPIYDNVGVPVDSNLVEKGQAGASRPNAAISDNQTILIYEESKNSAGLDEGKFVRYNTFPFNSPPTLDKGCIISNPAKGGKRARILTQSTADAGAGGVNVAVFWREGDYNKGGPADIVVRRGMGGLTPDKMVPTVDTALCVTSDYATATTIASAPAENISSSSTTATSINLSDDTESLAHPTENALAHHGFLRGDTLVIGYTYTSDLVKLWAQLDNYNFWMRKYTLAGGWANPFNASNITDMNINVREPRVLSTPRSTGACATDLTQCQNKDIYYVAWGTQENVQPFDLEGGRSLGVYITASLDALNTLAPAVQLSSVAGPLYGDDECAIECEVATRPDGMRFWSIWNQENGAILTPTGSPVSVAEFTSGNLAIVADPVDPTPVDPAPVAPAPVAPAPEVSSGGGGCAYNPEAKFDPTLPAILATALVALGLRRRKDGTN